MFNFNEYGLILFCYITCTAVSQLTVADLGFFVNRPISPNMLPDVKKSIRLAFIFICDPDGLSSNIIGLPGWLVDSN
jgi:hypothetical protein